MEECAESSGDAKREANVEQEKFSTGSVRERQRSCKYPNPDVPEFYPRNFASAAAATTTTTTTTTMTATTAVILSSSKPQQLQEDCDGIGDHGGGGGIAPHWTSYMAAAAAAAADVENLREQLNTKEKQLVHLNNVVKALLEEIWNQKESRITRHNREQWKDHISFAVNQFLKPTIELGFRCDDCCNRFEDYIMKMLKQQERNCSRLLLQYKANLMESISLVVERSIRVLTPGLNVNSEAAAFNLLKQDVFTQTDKEEWMVVGTDDDDDDDDDDDTAASNLEEELRRTQPTKVPRGAQAYYRPRGLPTYPKELLPVNPIQFVHQRYRNLNCRLQGIPEKNLVKFSYILNGKEYSATASTKKEAQYHCASHVLEATKGGNF